MYSFESGCTCNKVMASMKAISNSRNSVPVGKQSLLPPKCPFPIIAPSSSDYGAIGSKGLPRPRDGQKHHQRTSSESFLIEEQPSWLDDLLNEPETPVKKGAHRRSSSDSFAYTDGSCIYSNKDGLTQEEYMKKSFPMPSPWDSQEFYQIRDVKHVPYYPDVNSFGQPQHRVRELVANKVNSLGSVPVANEKVSHRGASYDSTQTDALASNLTEIKEQQERNQDVKGANEQKEGSRPKPTELDPKRAKQQFAQRSRVRKLQYIAELERNVQALQAGGLEFSAELEFLDQQNLILNLENKALKQRLDTLAQEQLIKRLQQEMLEQEIARLRSLYQQQQHQQQSHATSNHGRNSSRDLDSQFANLSLKYKDPNAVPDPINNAVHI